MIVTGFITNRLNVSITALQSSSAVYYVPKWTEFAATLATIAAAVVAFRYAVIYLDILPKTRRGSGGWFRCSRQSVTSMTSTEAPGEEPGAFV